MVTNSVYDQNDGDDFDGFSDDCRQVQDDDDCDDWDDFDVSTDDFRRGLFSWVGQAGANQWIRIMMTMIALSK